MIKKLLIAMLFTCGSVWAGPSRNIAEIHGYEISVGSGPVDNGTQRVVLATGTSIGSVDVLSVIASSTTNKVTIYPAATLTITDDRYNGKVSTHTAGKLIVTGNIPTINFNVTEISYYSAGGLTAITGIGGTTYIPSGSSLSQSFEIGFSTPTITATLAASTTLYYDIIGTR